MQLPSAEVGKSSLVNIMSASWHTETTVHSLHRDAVKNHHFLCLYLAYISHLCGTGFPYIILNLIPHLVQHNAQ